MSIISWPRTRGGRKPPAGVPVVLVHGLWMTGWEMGLLGSRLRACGFQPYRFSYNERRQGLADNARVLHAWLARVPGDSIHFVAHSLGGLVLLHLWHLFPQQRPGRLVFLGTPATGSEVARRLRALPLSRALLGASLERGLGGGAPAWSGQADLGVIAGTRGLGMGRLLGGLTAPHDGTVAVAETQVPGVRERLDLPVSHMGLVFSAEVARRVCRFLRHGGFQGGGAP